jgi:hypothetical protein
MDVVPAPIGRASLPGLARRTWWSPAPVTGVQAGGSLAGNDSSDAPSTIWSWSLNAPPRRLATQ